MYNFINYYILKKKASSPDELALLNFAKFIGCEFLDLNEENKMVIN